VTLLGNSAGFRRALALAQKVAATDASVFISGESGTGKEEIAQYIHHHSRRSSRPLVAVNCAALPEALLESEMFGHLQGAFTGAHKDKPGLLEAANGGTLFLDEITEMPVSLQAKLLRVIQDGVVRRLGSTTTDAVVNVRFIAATNRDPQKAAADNLLRTDLFYRLCVVPIHIPPLRERQADIPLLAEHFLVRYWAQHRDRREPQPTFTQDAIASLQSRPWAGQRA
jgi:two-component system, response regulator FlrC